MNKQHTQPASRALAPLLTLCCLSLSAICAAQGISSGINGAAAEVRGIFASVSNLVLMVGAVVGLAGGIRVFIKWNNGDQDVQKELIGWAGACIFLLLSGVTLKLFFGV
jgi:hypothetical protein